MTPEMQPADALLTGQVGYLVTGLREIKSARIGDTWQHHQAAAAPLPGFPPAKAMIFAGASCLQKPRYLQWSFTSLDSHQRCVQIALFSTGVCRTDLCVVLSSC
jgi:translation elongation factor EF-4